ncbi:MAG: hypothetical protein JSW39_23935 [Desulfobacterales bacterium]|nr:MAG: hypothetical protein JSW39_23935 [Desulfobacterales bacterium]
MHREKAAASRARGRRERLGGPWHLDPVENPAFAEPSLKISGDVDRYNHREGNDDYGQPRALFNLFDDGQKARLYANIAESMQGVPKHIIDRQLGHFEKVHPNYTAGVRKALADLAEVTR